MNRHKKRAGFALVELLTLAAITAVLAAMFLPLISVAREKAKQAVCLNNLKQAFLGHMMYVQDYNGYLPSNGSGVPSADNTYWSRVLAENLKYISTNVTFCPSAPPKEYVYVTGRCYASYGRGFNRLYEEPKRLGKSLTNIMLLVDSLDSRPNIQAQTWTGYGYADYAVVHCRHNGMANVLFADGHVEALNKEALISGAYVPTPQSAYVLVSGKTLPDINFPEATDDYLEAYKLFLQANVYDKSGDYDKAVNALRRVNLSAKSQEVRLRCLSLITLSLFLDNKPSEAHQAGLETLNLAKTYLINNPDIVLLDKIVSSVQNREIQDSPKLISLVSGGEETAGLIRDLVNIQKGRDAYQNSIKEKWTSQELIKNCWEEYQPEFNKQAVLWAAKSVKELGLSPEAAEELKKELEEKFRKTGFFLPAELEKSFTEAATKSLFGN